MEMPGHCEETAQLRSIDYYHENQEKRWQKPKVYYYIIPWIN